MSANYTPYPENRYPSKSHSRAQALRAVLVLGGKLTAQAHRSPVCCVASAFVPISDENRDGGRAFSRSLRVKPTPFRGFGPHSPPSWRTRGRRSDCPCPSQEKSDFLDMSGRLTAPGRGFSAGRLLPGPPYPYTTVVLTHGRRRSCGTFLQ